MQISNINLNYIIIFVGLILNFNFFEVNGETRWVSPGNGSVFRIIDASGEKRTRDNAKAFCEGIGANLAIIKTQHENDVLHASTEDIRFHWIGLTRAANST